MRVSIADNFALLIQSPELKYKFMPHISSFTIEALNDFYSYRDCAIEGSLKDLLIIYGDNGSGKTTVLNLIFHLLSSASDRGHLNSISKVPFKQIRVNLSDGSFVQALRLEGTKSFPIEFSVSVKGNQKIEYRYIPESLRDRLFQERLESELIRTSSKSGLNKKHVVTARDWLALTPSKLITKNSNEGSHKIYITELEKLEITCYIMATDRRMKSDALEKYKARSRVPQEMERADDDVIGRVRTTYLQEALNSAGRYINQRVISATNVGSKDTNDIFIDLIKKISAEHFNVGPVDPEVSLQSSIDKLHSLERDNKLFAGLGISPELNFEEIIPSIEGAPNPTKPILEKILKPYIDGVSARLRALEPIGEVMRTFLGIINNLLRFKQVKFTPYEGFTIHGYNYASLEASQLSSGEQQLLLMFCYLLISNEHNSIFMIDEPEISLNVKWQRELISAMRSITKGSGGQLIIATHSIELLSQYSDMVIGLNPIFENHSIAENEARTENN